MMKAMTKMKLTPEKMPLKIGDKFPPLCSTRSSAGKNKEKIDALTITPPPKLSHQFHWDSLK
jgi:predicted RNA-binding protein with PUA domain